MQHIEFLRVETDNVKEHLDVVIGRIDGMTGMLDAINERLGR